MTKEAEMLCENCKKKMLKNYPDLLDCVFRHDNEYCSRVVRIVRGGTSCLTDREIVLKLVKPR